MSELKKSRTFSRKNTRGLALSAPPAKSAVPSAGDAQIPGALGNDVTRSDTLEIGVEFKLDLRSEDLIVLKELGAGNGGTVSKVMHAATKVIMAKKVIHVEAKKDVRKQIVRELHIMHDCTSPNIVTFYGAFLHNSGDVIMCMEYMDCGSLDRISKDFGPVRVDVLGKIAEAILSGLNYLYEVHRIMHRDIKPSNVLVSSRGYIKLCDFGVSGELVNSIADTFVGTSTYMAPERIQGAKYSIKSDVWSVGLTLMELAIGRFPFDASDAAAGDRASAGPMGILDLLQQIVHEPAPKLPQSDAFPPILDQMIQKCILKKPEDRPSPRELYDEDSFLQAAKRTPVNLEEWAVQMMERHNRKSHLAPQLSPSTQALLRGETIASPSKESSASKTPTSGEIPIAGGDDMNSSPPLDMSAVQRALPTEVNGSKYPTPSSSYERPLFPPRTSSTSAIQSSRSRDSEIFNATIKSSRSRDSETFNSAIFPPPRSRDSDAFSPATFPQPRSIDSDTFNPTTFSQPRPRDSETFNPTTFSQPRPRDSETFNPTAFPQPRPRDSETFNPTTFPQPRPRDSETFNPTTFPQPRPRDSETFNSSTFPQPRPRDSDSSTSSPVVQSRPWESDNYSSTTVLPIRPAPPPSGPLPPPPSASLRTSISRRQATNGLAYTNGEHSQY